MAATDEFDPDLVAAFIDGKLSGADRERVVRLLAESEAAFEIYADAVRAHADLQADGVIPFPVPNPYPIRRPRWLTVGAPLAAAAALFIAVIPTVESSLANAAFAMRADAIAQPLTAHPQLAMAVRSALDEPRWAVTRGGVSTVVETKAALRLGARATDLQVALAVGDRERAARVTAEMVELLDSVNLSDAARAEYGELRQRIATGDSLSLVKAAATADEHLRDFLKSRWYGTGKWLAAGELAARAHSADFFKSSETKRFIKAAIRSGEFAPDEVQALRQVEGAAERGVAENEFEMVRETFAKLIERHAS